MKFIARFSFMILLFAFAGCLSWDEGWKSKSQPSGSGNVKELLSSAAALESTADSGDNIKKIISAYEKVFAADPSNFDALDKLAEYSFLYGYTYASDKNERGEYYIKAIKFSEQAMYTNPEFKKLADQGKPAWEALEALTEKDLGPMYWWYVCVGLSWNDLNPVSRLANFYWPGRGKVFLERMTAINPDWHQGRIQMSWGNYYSIVPGFLGGDIKKSEEKFSKAIQLGPDALVNFYNRAKYLDVKKRDKDAFKKDLEYILSKDPRKSNYSYHWTVAYQKMAKELLAESDKLF